MDHHPGTTLMKPAANRGADTPSTTRHQYDLIFHVLFPRLRYTPDLQSTILTQNRNEFTLT